MSSVFTFDPDPPEVLSSPWPMSLAERQRCGSTCQRASDGFEKIPLVTSLTDYGIESLNPEPQDGPTEYKLHLLLRPRRSFAALSTVQRVSGSHSSKSRAARLESGIPVPTLKVPATAASSNQSRESRLQNLTTQLLWRLQQSSPHHSASRSDLIVPVLPGVLGPLDAPRTPEKLIPGLGDSQGALYEIGVADDGTLVGLTDDELDESLAVLRAMAYSLGCEVQVLRRVIVGDCQWLEDDARSGKTKQKLRKERVCVAEALVSPALVSKDSRNTIPIEPTRNDGTIKSSSIGDVPEMTKRTNQLRVSLTGSTTSGKSSLLGTLSTSTLDNGRGKSRLSLLRHRHEIASGVTSSVTGSLIGYHDGDIANDSTARFQVINYASGDVSSWTDIHSASDPGRLVYLNDSAGHPKFRRTTVRGLVSWAPHWTLCCIAADYEQDSAGRAGATASASDILGSSCAEIDLARAHLELCLNLGLPLVVVITKIELASIGALKRTLGKILSQLKSAGRRPEILSGRSNEQLQMIDRSDELEVLQLFPTVSDVGACCIVPIVLTSAVTGKGVSKLHALLRHLPICNPFLPFLPFVGSPDESADETFRPSLLFHIDEIFAATNINRIPRQGNTEIIFDSILSGHLHHGSLVVGQELLLGPFSTSSSEEDAPLLPQEMHRANSYPRIKGSPKANHARRIPPRPLSGDFPSATRLSDESAQAAPMWRRVRICSIRNLRLPVNSLSSDQVGTISLGLPVTTVASINPAPLASQDRIRKGMVLLNLPDESTFNSMQAYNGFVALLKATESFALYPGASVIAYIASIRAPARIIDSRILPTDATSAAAAGGAESLVQCNNDETGRASDFARVTCEFLSSQEWFQIDSQVLLMPASGFDISNAGSDRGERLSVGLEGLVGRIVQGLH
ncbi:MAG: hypothetical protein Q9186_001968 [Xanthomendoza sp. 1 TL-2023]